MRILKIPYSLWEEVKSQNSLKCYYMQENSSAARVWVGDRDVVYTTIAAGADYAGFVTNHLVMSLAVESEDEAIARIVGLGASLSSVRSDGVMRVQVEPAGSTKTVYEKGFRFDPAPATAQGAVVTEHAIVFNEQVEFQGLEFILVTGAHNDDAMNLSVYMPSGTTIQAWEGVLGAGSWPAPLEGMTVLPVDIELAVFADNVYLPADGSILRVIAEGTSRIVPPMALKLKYTAHEQAPVPAPQVRGMVRVWK